MMGREEFTRNAYNAPDRSQDVEWDSEAWRDAAKKAWNDLKNKNVPDPTLTTLEDVSADLVDTTETKT